MKKRSVLFFIWLLSIQCGFAQVYYVTRISGDIKFNGNTLKLYDKLPDLSHIYSKDKNAELFTFNPKKGKARFCFVNGKPVKMTKGEAGKPEWYELTVGEFVLDYTFNKRLTVRGDFDLFTFFNHSGSDGGINKILLVEGQELPVKSKRLNTRPGDKFFLCQINGKDTLCNPIARKNDELIFDKVTGLNEPDTCIIRLGYTEDNNYHEEYFPKPAVVTFLKQSDLKILVDLFKRGLSSHYHNNSDELLDDVEDHLVYCYGNFYQPAIHKLILADLNK